MPVEAHTISAESERRNITNRLRRLEGQVRGLQSMISGGQECEAVMTQLMAARSALGQVGLHVIGYSMKRCLGEEATEDRGDLVARAFDVFMDYRAVAAESSPARIEPPASPDEIVERLRELEADLRSVQETLAAGGPCDRLVADIGDATAVLNEVALGVLGHSMRRCLNEESGDREAVIDEAIAMFLKYSACLK